MPRVVAVINQKGGVGKTTTVANLGAALSRMGHRVLLLDMDHQANLSSHFGWKGGNHPPLTMYDILTTPQPLSEAIQRVEEASIDIVCSDIRLAGADLELGPQVGREMLLQRKLSPVKDGCDWILVDCPPSLGVLSMNAVVAASEIMIPLETEYFALEGMDHLLRFIKVIQERLHSSLSVSWIVPCAIDARRAIDRDVVEHVEKHFPDKLTKARIRKNVALVECGAHGVDIFRHDQNSNGAKDYAQLAREIAQ